MLATNASNYIFEHGDECYIPYYIIIIIMLNPLPNKLLASGSPRVTCQDLFCLLSRAPEYQGERPEKKERKNWRRMLTNIIVVSVYNNIFQKYWSQMLANICLAMPAINISCSNFMKCWWSMFTNIMFWNAGDNKYKYSFPACTSTNTVINYGVHHKHYNYNLWRARQ